MPNRAFSRWRGRTTIGVLVGAVLAVVAPSLTAQTAAQNVEPPRRFAIENVRIVTVSGDVINRGTVVINDGLIHAVGTNVNVPADAWIIDGTDRTVYPGLIDALSTLGIPGEFRRDGESQGQQPYAWGPQDRPATTSWVSAADHVDGNDRRIATWRAGGYTSVVAAPNRGLFSGQAAVINLAGENDNLVVRPDVGHRVNYTRGPGFRGFPNSLMGSIAYARQLFIDARQYNHAVGVYEDDPQGLERPAYDRALEPLRSSLSGSQPVLLPGNSARETHRSIKLAQEAGVTPVVYGGHEAYRVLDALRDTRTPILVDAGWPRASADTDPEAVPTLATLRLWDRAPTSPAALAAANIPFAFYAGGADNPNAVRAAVRRAIDHGLSAEHAIRALTLSVAEIFGVDDRLGSIEAGKIANLIVTDGDLFDAETSVQMVFVDGHQFTNDSPQTGGDAWNAPPARVVASVNDRGPIQTPDVTVIQNATILTAATGTIENGSMLIRDGRIAEIGQNIAVPRGANVIDATGKYVTPGIIDAHSHIAADAINEGSIVVSSMVGIEDVLNPDQVAIYRAVAGGVTSANILHGSANPIGGKNAIIKLRWGADADGLLFAGAPLGIKFALGENPLRTRNPARYPNTRLGVMDVIRQAFVDAREYRNRWETYRAASSRGDRVLPPARDLEMEALVEVLEGERLVHAHSYRADEILQLLRLAEEFGFRIATFQHVLEGYRIADELAAHGAGASTFSDWWGFKVEAYDAIPHNAALMTDRGVLVSINSDSGEEIRHLNQEAAKAMKWGGLSEQEALRLITLNPARQLGVADRVGSLEVGKDADFVIFANHPLSSYAQVEQTWIDGHLFFDRQHDLDRRSALQVERDELAQKHRRGGRGDVDGGTDAATDPVTDPATDPEGGAR